LPPFFASTSPSTDLFGWIAVDPNLGAAVICQEGPGLWTLMANSSPLCGDWPPATCNVDLVTMFMISTGCIDDAPVAGIGNFFWTTNLPCYEDVWFQRYDLGTPGPDGELTGPPSGCWETVAHFTPASGWMTPWGSGYPLADYGVQQGHLYLYRVMARMNGVMEGVANVLLVAVGDCSDEGDGSGGGGSSGSSSGGPILSTNSQLYLACEGAPSGAAAQLWLPPLVGALAGLPPVQQAQDWCYVAASPAQTRQQPPDVNPTGFFGQCGQCEQSLSQMGSGSIGDGNPGYGSSGGNSGGNSGGSSGGSTGSGLGPCDGPVNTSGCKCRCGGYWATLNCGGAPVTLSLGPANDGSCNFSASRDSFSYILSPSGDGWSWGDNDLGFELDGSIPSDPMTGCPEPGSYSGSDSNGDSCTLLLTTQCGPCLQGSADCPSGGC
jgi:hypothetical protein